MKYRKGLIYRTWVKALCFVFFIVSMTLFVLSGLATAFMLSENVYITDIGSWVKIDFFYE